MGPLFLRTKGSLTDAAPQRRRPWQARDRSPSANHQRISADRAAQRATLPLACAQALRSGRRSLGRSHQAGRSHRSHGAPHRAPRRLRLREVGPSSRCCPSPPISICLREVLKAGALAPAFFGPTLQPTDGLGPPGPPRCMGAKFRESPSGWGHSGGGGSPEWHPGALRHRPAVPSTPGWREEACGPPRRERRESSGVNGRKPGPPEAGSGDGIFIPNDWFILG